MKKVLFIVFVIAFLVSESYGKYSGGDGSAENPYLIATPEDLNDIGNHIEDFNKYFVMVNDINLVNYTAEQFNIIGTWETWHSGIKVPFEGFFDGDEHTISNFTYTTASRNGVGLFAYLNNNGIIKNLHLSDVDVNSASGYVIGSLVGYNDGTVQNCSVNGNIHGHRYVGGLVGQNETGTIENCYVNGNISAIQKDVGGISSRNEGVISNSWTTGNIYGGHSAAGVIGQNDGLIWNCFSHSAVIGESQVGGLVGISHVEGTISNCFATGDVMGQFSVGGLVGDNSAADSLIINCYAIGDVNGVSCVGGLVGRNYALVYNCYSAGRVDCDLEAGGLIGCEYSPTYKSSFWNGDVNPDVNAVGNTDINPEGIFKETTANMQIKTTYLDKEWDFVGEFQNGPSDLWSMPDSEGYPVLWFEDSNLPPITRFSKGTGVLGDPYNISNVNDINSIGYNPRLMVSHFLLINDINISEVNFYAIGHISNPFLGVFDGSKNAVHGFRHHPISEQYVGFFKYIGKEGTVMDFGLMDLDVNSTEDWYVGGLAGYSKGTVSGCYVEGAVTGGYYNTGGLIGWNKGLIQNSYAKGRIKGNLNSNPDKVGGLVGYNDGIISSCYYNGAVEGYGGVGGLVGSINNGIVTNSFSKSNVSGNSSVGGLVGTIYNGNLMTSYSDSQVLG
ncbi:MAG: GLUG motif-containing protein, partial [Planctomycetota bacterium]